MDNVLLVGEDSVLLQARAAILSKTCANVICCNALELGVNQWRAAFDLVILCHTLKPGVQRSVIVADIYRHWPQARILQVLTDSPASAELGGDADIVTGDLGEQGELLELAMELLGKAKHDNWQPLSSRFPMRQAS